MIYDWIGADPVALPLFAASARAAVVVPRCPWNLQAGRSDRCGVPGFTDGWLVFGCSYGRGDYPPFTAFGVFLAGLGGMLAINGIVSFLSFRESGALSGQVLGYVYLVIQPFSPLLQSKKWV